jgi:multidrug resistance efflux pump
MTCNCKASYWAWAATRARAELRQAEKTVEASQAQHGAAGAKIRQTDQAHQAAAAEITRLGARAAYVKRIEPLVPKQYVSTDAYRQATADRDAAADAVADARAKHQAAATAIEAAVQERTKAQADLAQFGQAYARIDAKARLRGAELDLEYCSVKSPLDGHVTNLNIAVGQYVQPGQKLFAIVDDRTWYVIQTTRRPVLLRCKKYNNNNQSLASFFVIRLS